MTIILNVHRDNKKLVSSQRYVKEKNNQQVADQTGSGAKVWCSSGSQEDMKKVAVCCFCQVSVRSL